MPAGGPSAICQRMNYYDQKEISLGSLVVCRTSAQMFASVNKPLVYGRWTKSCTSTQYCSSTCGVCTKYCIAKFIR
jgi:hypothetical protein